jgi:Questin oxidase-like
MSMHGVSGSIDEAYEELAHAAAELPNGFVNHGPMACEALVALGYEDRAPEWAHRYALTPMQVASGGDPFEVGHWQDSLGRIDQLHAWTDFFIHALDDEGWPSVVRRWVPRLLPAMGSVLFHGMIRTGHAVRAVATVATAPRLAELARALGYWAARYDSGRIAGQLVLPESVGTETAGHAATAILGEAELAARRYLARPTTGILHGVTGAMALALLEPHLDEADATRATEQLARVERALASGTPAVRGQRTAPAFDHFGALAVDSGDPHQVKLVEACARAYRETSIDTFAGAAALVTSAQSRPRG